MMSDNASTDEFSLSQLGKNYKAKEQAYVKVRASIGEDMLAWLKTWARYCRETRGTRESANSITACALQAWWNKQRRKIVAGEGIKLPDWQCAIRNSEYALFTESVFFAVPRELRDQLTKAITNGHIYACWQKPTLAAVTRVALEAHYNENAKYVLRYLKELSWHVDIT